MSDGANHPQQPPRGTASSPAMPRTPSSQTNPRVMTAARSAPLPKEEQDAIGKRLKSEGANVALNAVSILKEMVQDFRQQDRFFKYKAFIVGGWLLLSVITLGATCGRGVKTMGDYGAKLIPVTSRASLTILNKSSSSWTDVTVVVTDNRGAEWRASVARVDPSKDLTITPKQLLGADGRAAPQDIVIRGVEMRTSEGRARLMENGVNLTEETPQ